jgi:phosphatidylserine/phosphatidylglycerophosphate/cardiolipin synthase-like enzyme
LAQEELRDPKAGQVTEWLEDVIKVLRPRPPKEPPRPRVYFSPGDECLNAIRGLLDRAKKTVEICVFTITDDRITDTIFETAGRGVKVRIITDDDKSLDAGSDIFRLRSRGVPVRCDRSEYHMHHKFAIFDRQTVLTGSYNWTRGAADRNEENLVVLQDSRLAGEFHTEFERLWEEFRT